MKQFARMVFEVSVDVDDFNLCHDDFVAMGNSLGFQESIDQSLRDYGILPLRTSSKISRIELIDIPEIGDEK